MNKVIKRNGQEVDFKIEKIEKAISAANNEVEGVDNLKSHDIILNIVISME